jgi:hypothetical protein
MFRFIAKVAAKISFRWKQELEAGTNEIAAALATRNAEEKRELVARVTKEADEMDARIKEVSEMEEKGLWLCENGHESPPQFESGSKVDTLTQTCECGKPAKFIKRDQMTGQEKYESDKDRGEAQKIADDKRATAKAEEEDAANSEKTAKYFRDLATNNRTIADKIRRL